MKAAMPKMHAVANGKERLNKLIATNIPINADCIK